MLCYFIEVAFINILAMFIRRTTGAERKLLRLGGEMPGKVLAAANEMFTPSERLALWGLQSEACSGGLPFPLKDRAAQTCSCA